MLKAMKMEPCQFYVMIMKLPGIEKAPLFALKTATDRKRVNRCLLLAPKGIPLNTKADTGTMLWRS
jgi:hypothetical protein